MIPFAELPFHTEYALAIVLWMGPVAIAVFLGCMIKDICFKDSE